VLLAPNCLTLPGFLVGYVPVDVEKWGEGWRCSP
jgi:hypothetical protein